MDYAIYKTNDGMHPRIIHRFMQETCNHKALSAARNKLDEMWRRVQQQHPALRANASASKDEFQYEHISSVNTKERIRFYIAPLKNIQ